MAKLPMRLRALLLVACCAGATGAASDDSILRQALEDELERNMNELELEGVAKPHFIAYTVHDDHQITVSAANGGLGTMSTSRTRRLQIEVRVGTPQLDNSNFISQSTRNRRTNVSLPLEDDYALLRKQIWLATDRAYKNAVEVYAAKEAALQNSQQEPTLDFSTEKPYVYDDDRRSPDLDAADVRKFARAISKIGDDSSFIHDRGVSVFANKHLDTYANSEGSYFTRIDDTAFIRVTAWTQSDDGRYVSDYVNLIGRAWKDIADLPKVKLQVKSMHERLAAVRDAEPLDRYNGPVLFQRQAAAELIGQSLAANLVNFKQPVFENDNIAAMFNRAIPTSSLKERLGARVLPRSWNVYDDPTQETHNGASLVGHYPVDSDGLKTRRVTLVERGILKTLLTDRNPTDEIQSSTASNATGSNPSVSNLFVDAKDGLSDPELKQLLLDIVAENDADFGVRIDMVANPYVQVSGIPSPFLGAQLGEVIPATRAFKVYPNGDEELVRHVVVRTELLSELKNLPGYSATTSVHHTNYMFLGGDVSSIRDAVPVFVSIATPDILLEDASVSYPQGIVRSLPIVPHPQAK